MLDVTTLDVYHSDIQTLKQVSLHVQQGEFVAVIGTNGAGKTTLLRAISGLQRTRAGVISFNGRPITNVPPERLVRLGLTHSPEGRQVFANLTVGENLDLGAYCRQGRDSIEEDRSLILGLFPRLRERYGQRAGTLSGGEQQMLALGRALMARPSLLLLDEPSLGVAPRLARTVLEKVAQLNCERRLTVLLVEQNAQLALRLARRAYVLETGRVVLEGLACDLTQDSRVREHYLGGAA